MTARKKVSPDEIKQRLIADAENPDAWEPLGAVASSSSPRPAWYGQSARPSQAAEHTNVVLLEPDVAKVFKGSAVVNQALREYLSEHGAPPKVSKAS
jgi:hypothetical protein